MRPKNPKSGKKIFIEKINFIWKKIKFSEKITIRNIFRYKARVFTTIFGIAGCTALILAGFGLKDSIKEVTNYQFNNIFKYMVLCSICLQFFYFYYPVLFSPFIFIII